MCYDRGVLQAFLDNELPANQMDAVSEHLSGCAACRRVLHELESNAEYVNAAIESYTEGLVFDNSAERAWEQFSVKRYRRRWWSVVVNTLGSRRMAMVAVAASLIAVFVMGSIIIGPNLQKETANVEATRVEKQAARQAPGEKDDHEAGTLSAEPTVEVGKAPEGTGAVRSAVPSETRDGQTGEVPAAPKAMWCAESAHVPIDPSTVSDVSYSVAGGEPVPVTGEEKEQLIAWFNKGAATGLSLQAAERETEKTGPVLSFTLADSTVITVVYLNPEEVSVKRPEGVYSIRAPELSLFLHLKGGEAIDGIADR